MTRAFSNPFKILVYSGQEFIGDGLMKLPYLYALRHAYPEAHITWMAGQNSTVYASTLKPLVQGVLDGIVDWVKVGEHWKETLQNPLPGHHYDLIVDTQKNLRITLILKRISHKKFLSHTWKGVFSSFNTGVWLRSRPKHDIQRLFSLTSLGGRPLELKPYAPPLPPLYTERVKVSLPVSLPLEDGGPVYIGLAPGAGHEARGETKCWPLERYSVLAQGQVKKGRIPVFILGPEETSWFASLKHTVPEALFPLQEPGVPTSPLYTVALAQRLGVIVCNDSGTGHMCALSGRPLISLFGPTRATKLAPITPHGQVLTASQFKPNSHKMEDIPFSAVEDAVEHWLYPNQMETGRI